MLNYDVCAFLKKPRPGTGLWTSSWCEESQDSEWVQWCRSESFGDVDARRWYLLTPRPNLVLYEVDALADLHRLLKTYSWQPQYLRELNKGWEKWILASDYNFFTDDEHFAWVDFERLAEDYDGLHLTSEGNAATHLSYPQDMNAWDCESTVWFRWCFCEVKEITPVPLRE